MAAPDAAAYAALLDDLAAEQDALDDVVAGIDEDAWTRPTPAEGWDVRMSLAHLAASEMWAALALSRWLTAILFGVPAHDGASFVAVGIALSLVTLVASALPARRAARIDPIAALRED